MHDPSIYLEEKIRKNWIHKKNVQRILTAMYSLVFPFQKYSLKDATWFSWLELTVDFEVTFITFRMRRCSMQWFGDKYSE